MITYQARSLYSIVNEDASLYTDEGGVERGFSYGRAMDTTSNDDIEQELIINEKLNSEMFTPITNHAIFPNPAQKMVNIMSTKSKEILLIHILDVYGKVLMSKRLNITDYKAELDFDLLNGIYFVNLVNDQGAKTVKKLVITKD